MAESEQVLRVRKINNRSHSDTSPPPHTVMIFEKMVDAVAVQYSSRRYLEEGSWEGSYHQRRSKPENFIHTIKFPTSAGRDDEITITNFHLLVDFNLTVDHKERGRERKIDLINQSLFWVLSLVQSW
jgi:hypothetical protein